LPFAESIGGVGGGPFEMMLVMQAFGRALVLEPYLSTVVLGGTAINLAGAERQRADLLPRVAAGTMKLAFASSEPQARYDLSDVLTIAKPANKGWVLNGEKCSVLHGDSADMLIVSARTNGVRDEPGGITLFLVDAQSQGLSRRPYTLRDGSRAAQITLADVQVSSDTVLGEVDAGLPVMARVIEAGIAANCAEVVGAMEAIHDMTLEYIKTRKQFGQPIGRNQVLQHRSAEMFVAVEQARSMAMYAAMAMSEPDPAARERGISMAKVAVSQAGKFVSQQGIQLHGGIGIAEECAVGHYFRRIMVIEHTFGDTAYHLARLAERVG
jgi:alkylation response protein AidB-like acyl-CoA dehydrogenase